MNLRKNRTFLVVLTILLISNNSYCQEVDELGADEEKLRIHFAPLNLFDPATGVLQLGVQKSLNKRFAVLIDYGLKAPLLKSLGFRASGERKNYAYSKTKIELKYFFNLYNQDMWSRIIPYLSLEGMYFPQNYQKENSWIYREGHSYLYEYSEIRRTVFVASLKFGKEKRYNKVIIDKFIGIGLRQITIKHQTAGEIEADFEEPIDLYFPSLDQNEGTFFRPHVSLGIKFGYPIRKNNYKLP